MCFYKNWVNLPRSPLHYSVYYNSGSLTKILVYIHYILVLLFYGALPLLVNNNNMHS